MKEIIWFTILVALAIGGFYWFAVKRPKNLQNSEKGTRSVAASRWIGLVLLVVFGLLALSAWPNNVSAGDDSNNDNNQSSQEANFSGSNCEKNPKVAEEADYGINNPQTMSFAASGGNLIGNGPPLDSSSASAAVKDLYNRTESNPKLTANLAYVMRLSGFTPKDETRDQVTPDVAFLDARVASLVSDKKLWSQTRRNICTRLGDASMDADPYKDRDLTEITTRVADVEAEGVLLPVTNVVLGRTTQPDGVRLLWINRDVDDTGERPNKFPIAVDVQYAWPAIVGEIPESAEKPAPKSEQQVQQDQQFQQQQEQQSQQRQSGQDNTGGGGSTKGSTNGKTNGASDNCNASGCGNQPSVAGPGPSGGCASNCPGVGAPSGPGPSGPCIGNCGGSTPTTSKPTTTHVPPPTTPPPTSPPTTRPPTTTTMPPPPTTRPTTTLPPPTTAPPTTKAPDPGCAGMPGCTP